MLAKARARLHRLTAQEAAEHQSRGALLVDIRTLEQRTRDGNIPGAIAIERTVLEWRLDPTSPWRIDEATGPDIDVILICAEGYSSSLAAASLQELGLPRATDVIDGFEAWRSAGLPITR
jgi:rhodanese-related sulfurtransferase